MCLPFNPAEYAKNASSFPFAAAVAQRIKGFAIFNRTLKELSFFFFFILLIHMSKKVLFVKMMK